MFSRASFLPREAEQHQTLRMPLIATGVSLLTAVASRFLKVDVPSASFMTN